MIHVELQARENRPGARVARLLLDVRTQALHESEGLRPALARYRNRRLAFGFGTRRKQAAGMQMHRQRKQSDDQRRD
jgi:hypothetical protein